MNLNTEQYFSEIPQIHAPRSVFDRSFTHKTTMNVNKLYPIFIDEALPGDSFKLKFQVFGRLLNPLIVPVMDELYFETIWAKCPMRLLWSHSFNFFGEKINPSDSTDYVVPTINSGDTGFAVDSIFDHFGLPVLIPNLEVNSLPLRAYNRFFNEWLRDQNLVNSVSVPFDDEDQGNYYKLLTSAKMHDLFTSALPTTQLGNSVNIPIGDSCPVVGNGTALGLQTGPIGSQIVLYAGAGNISEIGGKFITRPGVTVPNSTTDSIYSSNWTTREYSNPDQGDKGGYYPFGVARDPALSGLRADLSSVTGINVNDLRFLIKLQQYREKLLSGGHRYREIVSQFFNVDQLDNRAYTTEFLGMTREMIDINTVIQTSSTDTTSPQGHLSAYGVINSHQSGFSTSFVEHSYILGLARIRHNPVYQQGLNKLWSRSVALDFYNPMFNGLGEQPIRNKEIVALGGNVYDADGETLWDDRAFGFNEAWYEYRYYPSLITGQLRSGIPQSLDCYHFAQWFGSYDASTGTYKPECPRLNQSFIEENIPIDRALSVQTSQYVPQFVMDFRFEYECARVMPVRNVPAGLYSGI